MKRPKGQRTRGRGSSKGRLVKPKLPGPVEPARNVSPWSRIQLYVRSGGRCEFPGCNRDLLRHPKTHSTGNFADLAHIYAFSPGGPRGGSLGRPRNVNSPENLIVLCQADHREIDRNKDKYPVRLLKTYKQKHEDRIRHLTSLTEDSETYVVQLKSNIGGKTVAIPAGQILSAVAPRYPKDTRGCVVDLTTINATGSGFMDAATQTIDRQLGLLFAPSYSDDATPRHLSVFALAPIPLLVYFGSKLSDKLEVEFYQFHRTKTWSWKTEAPSAEFSFECLRRGSDTGKVGLILALSGHVPLGDLPSDIDGAFSLYRITLRGQVPGVDFLRTREDLGAFRSTYRSAISEIVAQHGRLDAIHLFPACPAPVALACGHDLLHKAHPALIVYDYDKAVGGFAPMVRIN